MARRIEQGNILGFVLVGALLTALLLGGVYVVRNSNGANVATTTSITGNNNKPANKDTEPTGETSTVAKTDEQRLKETLAAQALAEKKAKEQQAANDAANLAATQSATALPVTGPEEAVVPLLGATLLAGTTFAYARSRRLI